MSHQKGARDGLQVGCQSFVFEVSVLFEGEVCWVASGGKVTQDTALPWVRGWRSLQVYSDGDEWRSVVTEPEHQWERIGKRRILIISLWQCLKRYPQKKRHSTATARCVQFLCCRLNWSINQGPSLYVQWGVVPRVGFIDPCGWSDGSWPKNREWKPFSLKSLCQNKSCQSYQYCIIPSFDIPLRIQNQDMKIIQYLIFPLMWLWMFIPPESLGSHPTLSSSAGQLRAAAAAVPPFLPDPPHTILGKRL